MFEYAKLQEVTRSYNWGWIFNDVYEEFYPDSLWGVINKLGKDGWQLVYKEKDGECRQYIMMREIK